MARKIYMDAWNAWREQKQEKTREPRQYYLDTTGDGWYLRNRGSGGSSIREICEGVKYPPRIKYVDMPQDQQQVIKDRLEKNKEVSNTKWKDDRKGKTFSGKTIEDENAEDTTFEVGSPGWPEAKAVKSGIAAQRFIEMHQGTAEVERVPSRSGKSKPNMKALLSDDTKKLFFKYREKDSKAKSIMSLEFDVSSSIGGRESQMGNAMHEAMEFFLSLFYMAGANQPDIQYSVGAISGRYDEVLKFIDCKNRDDLIAAPDALWTKGDRNGIDTPALIDGLKKKYAFVEKQDIPKTSLVFTDGGEVSGLSEAALKELVDEFESEYGVKLIFIGLTPDAQAVNLYKRWVYIDHEPTDEELISVILSIAENVSSGKELPDGDLVLEMSIPISTKEDSVFSFAKAEKNIFMRAAQHMASATQYEDDLSEAMLSSMSIENNDFNKNALNVAGFNKARFKDEGRLFYLIAAKGESGFSEEQFALLKELEREESSVKVLTPEEYNMLHPEKENDIVFFAGTKKGFYADVEQDSSALFYAGSFKEQAVISTANGRKILLNALIWRAAMNKSIMSAENKQVNFSEMFNIKALSQIPDAVYVKAIEEEYKAVMFRQAA